MSVLACDRFECQNIMCERLILDGTRYLCEDCWSELLRWKEEWPERMTVRKRIEDFMEERPGVGLLCRDQIDEAFRNLTRQRE